MQGSVRWAAAAVLACAGCASVSFEEFKEVRATRWPEREEKEGIVASVRPVVAPQEVAFFFSADLIGHGVLPVTVYLENTGEDTVTFQPEELVITYENGTVLTPVSWRDVHERVRYSYWRSVPGFFFVFFPGFMIAHSVSVANERLSHNYHQKALEQLSLPPGDHIQGVVFVAPEPAAAIDLDGLNGADARLLFSRRRGQRTQPFEMVFHLWGVL
jgi:hypothetical protein